MSDKDHIIYFGEVDGEGGKQKFGIKEADRTRHVYLVGKTGMGKSTTLLNMAIQDIQQGNGIAFVDPDGISAQQLLTRVPPARKEDVIYIAPFDMRDIVPLNIFENVPSDQHEYVALALVSAFEKAWEEVWSARMHHVLTHTFFALLEHTKTSTFLDVERMFADESFRAEVVRGITSPLTKAFWKEEFTDQKSPRTQETITIIRTKMKDFVSRTYIRNTIASAEPGLDFEEVVENKKILIANLSKEDMGEENTAIIGTILILKIYLAGSSRLRLDSREIAKRPYFFLYVDNAPAVTSNFFGRILSEARKCKLSISIAHQYLEQFDEQVRSAIFGNMGTIAVFRVGSFDANIFEKEFAPRVSAEDMSALGTGDMYLRLMIEGVGSEPFFATTLPLSGPERAVEPKEVVSASHEHVAHEAPATPSKEATPKREPIQTREAPKQQAPKQQAEEIKKAPQKQNIDTPFKKAFAQMGIDPEEVVSVEPVVDVNKEKHTQASKAKVRPDSPSDNREKLKEVVAGFSQQKPEEKKVPEEEPVSSQHDPKPAPPKDTTPKEIPEETLKKILE